MIDDLELHGRTEDLMAGAMTNIIAIADDVSPCASAENPREAIHQMQLLHNIVEDHGIRNHIEFGTDKYKLLISARPSKLRKVEN
jgi:hypothetical protein